MRTLVGHRDEELPLRKAGTAVQRAEVDHDDLGVVNVAAPGVREASRAHQRGARLPEHHSGVRRVRRVEVAQQLTHPLQGVAVAMVQLGVLQRPACREQGRLAPPEFRFGLRRPRHGEGRHHERNPVVLAVPHREGVREKPDVSHDAGPRLRRTRNEGAIHGVQVQVLAVPRSGASDEGPALLVGRLHVAGDDPPDQLVRREDAGVHGPGHRSDGIPGREAHHRIPIPVLADALDREGDVPQRPVHGLADVDPADEQARRAALRRPEERRVLGGRDEPGLGAVPLLPGHARHGDDDAPGVLQVGLQVHRQDGGLVGRGLGLGERPPFVTRPDLDGPAHLQDAGRRGLQTVPVVPDLILGVVPPLVRPAEDQGSTGHAGPIVVEAHGEHLPVDTDLGPGRSPTTGGVELVLDQLPDALPPAPVRAVGGRVHRQLEPHGGVLAVVAGHLRAHTHLPAPQGHVSQFLTGRPSSP